MTTCIRSVDEVERLTGIDFFPRLDDSVEDRVEGASKETMNQEGKVYKVRLMPRVETDRNRQHNIKRSNARVMRYGKKLN